MPTVTRAVAMAASIAAVAGLTACGSSSKSAAGTAAASSSGSKAKGNVVLITGVRGDPYYVSLACGVRNEAAKRGLGYEEQSPANFDPSLQIPILDAVIAKKPSAILVAPTDSAALVAPLKQAVDAGIKVILVDTSLNDTSFVTSAVASDDLAAGGLAGKKLAALIGNKGSVVTINTKPGVTTSDARVKGFEEAIKTFPGIKDLGVQFSNDDAAKSAAIVTSSLAAHPDLAGIFVTNTIQGTGAATGLRSSGKAPGTVKVIGFDAGPSGVQALEDGTIQGQVVLKPLDEGTIAVDNAAVAIAGMTPPKKVGTSSLVATKGNLQDAGVQKYLYKASC